MRQQGLLDTARGRLINKHTGDTSASGLSVTPQHTGVVGTHTQWLKKILVMTFSVKTRTQRKPKGPEGINDFYMVL